MVKFSPLGIVMAAVVASWQGPSLDSLNRISAMSVTGGECERQNYKSYNCSEIDSACTGGTAEMSPHTPGISQDYQTTGETYKTGNCTGGAGCPSQVNTDKVTTEGCSGE